MDNYRHPFIGSMAAAVVDTEGVVVSWTEAAEELLGRPAGEVCGRRMSELLADPSHWAALAAGRAGTAALLDGRGHATDVAFRVLPLIEDGPGRYLVIGAPAAEVARWREDDAFTRELFLQDRIGLAVFDEELRLTRTNTHLLPYTGVPGDLRGRRLADFLRAEDAEAIESLLREVLQTGRPLALPEALVRTVVDPKGGRVMGISAFRLQADGDKPVGVTALFTDITELGRSRRRLELLHGATAAVGGSLSVTGTCADLAAVLVPGLADAVVVEVAEAVLNGDEPEHARAGPLTLRRTAVAGAAAGLLPTGVPVVVDRAESSEPTLEEDAGRPAMTVALRARGIMLGRIRVHHEQGSEGYEGADLQLLQEIASRAALALDNARRYTREHRAAVSLQRSLLPPAATDTPAAVTASVYLPTGTGDGGVGGDWFDVIPLSSARIALVVGDVVGHGLEAAATMGRLRTAVRTLADLDLAPDELLVHLDDLVAQLVVEADQGGDGVHREPAPAGATCLYAVYDPVSRRCVMASAGHPPPAMVHPDGAVGYVELSPGPPLGVGGFPFEVTEIEPAAGSVLVLYTDGLIGGGEGDLDEGMAALRTRLDRARVTTRRLAEAGREITQSLPVHRLPDDVTLLLARTRVLPTDDTAAWDLDPEPAAVSRIREAVAEQLERWGLDSLVFTTELVVSELVTNAIRYGGGRVGVRLIRVERLICEVSDPSSTQPRMRRARLTDEGGRGLYLVAQLTNRWGSRHTDQGKTIWTEQEIPGPNAGTWPGASPPTE
ncbi:SpoIIE family protein phosphatase [Kitasatospora atroaurantiaca]|uniref:Serine phosphatase RsbU (Regulator of sigma subunit) n=1 Tax=Kitasatospora atroaurantiaca TaxID=285545 RepID=A0A561F177_9ACTN|nr:SpoIIE family protein phosphatase [Kitasatospora atroaurantiaca]TWE21620.1 serine phosphatase RsbU (regulator of sigma subunit) [Kitasatospora atroaurantiaca]